MDKTREAILEFAAGQAEREWNAKQHPYLLARLSPDLSAQGIDYKEVLGEMKLNEFVRTAGEKIKVVSHPSQKSKIGLIPPDKDFEYPVESFVARASDAATSRIERSGVSRRRYIVSNFLQLVSELDDADAAQVQIPTNILTRLMRDR